jgi:hypothetical protein
MLKKLTESEASARLAAIWEMTELAFSPVQDNDQLTFDTYATGTVVEFRNGKRILYSRNPSE